MPCLPQTNTTCFLSQRVGRHVLGFYISGIGQYVSASLIQHSIHVVTCISNSFPFCWLVVWSRWAAFGKMRWEGDALRKEWACVQAGMKRKREDSEPQGPAGSQSQLRLESYLTAGMRRAGQWGADREAGDGTWEEGNREEFEQVSERLNISIRS